MRSKSHCTGEPTRGRERLVEHAAVVVDVQVHDRARAERVERLRVDDARRERASRRRGAAPRRRPRRPRRRRRRAAADRCPVRTRTGVAERDARAGALERAPSPASPCSRWSGTAETPMSAASAASSRPGAEDLDAPRASDASSACRLSVGSAIRFQSAVDRGRALAVRAQPVAERLLVERGVVGVELAQRRARARTAASALAQREQRVAQRARSRGAAARACRCAR